MSDTAKSSSFSIGIWALAIKIGPKLLSLLAKACKFLKVGKFMWAGATFASYAYLLTWQFAAIIMTCLVIHEYGHIWAMHRCGMKTKGVYFIPFVGGAAVSADKFPDRKAEVYVAIMGPIFGLCLAMLSALLYIWTAKPMFAGAAAFLATVNLFNMLPVNPLDGGRIMKSVAFSLHSKLGLLYLFLGVIAAAFLAVYGGIGLFALLLVIGFLDAIGEFFDRNNPDRAFKKMTFGETLLSIFYFVFVVVALWGTVQGDLGRQMPDIWPWTQTRLVRKQETGDTHIL